MGFRSSLTTGAPAQGQYSVTSGVYAFNAADNGASVLLTYGYIPADLAQACLEWASQRFKSQQWIGLRSKSLGGQETISYDTGAMPAAISLMLQAYKRVTPC